MSDQSGGADARRRLALALLGTAFFMVILDGTIVYVALPQIGDDLGFSTAGLQLLGRRRVFTVGVGLFVSSSLLCGLAWSPAVLIGARVVQGPAGDAALAPRQLLPRWSMSCRRTSPRRRRFTA